MNAVILGSGPQALYVLRCLAKSGHSVQVLAFDRKVAFYSKYGEKFVANTGREFISRLKLLQGEVDKVFICGGKELQFILDEFPEVFTIHDVYPKPLEAIKIFSDKMNTYRFLGNFGSKSPCSYTADELLKSDTLKNTVIVKWNQEVNYVFKPSFKTKIFDVLGELKLFLSSLDADVRNILVIQDFICGEDSNNISIQVAFNNDCLEGSLVAKKIRVSVNGFTSYIEEIDMNEKLERQAFIPFIAALKELNYIGLAEAEFKICELTGDYFLIEVNPRPCGLSSALSGKYIDVASFFDGGGLVSKSNCVKVQWSSILRDVQTCLYRFKSHRSIKVVFRDLLSIFNANSYDVFDRDDIKPFFSQVRM